MPQEESQEIKELRRKMREGRTSLLDAIGKAYPPYLLARKSMQRKSSEVREQLGLLTVPLLAASRSCVSRPVTRTIAAKECYCCTRR